MIRWSYKTVHLSLKKEGLLGSAFLDEMEVEYSLNEYGEAGWELVSFVEVSDGLLAVFKQPLNQGLSLVEETPSSAESGESEEVAEDQEISPLPLEPGLPSDPPQGEDDGGVQGPDVGSIRIV